MPRRPAPHGIAAPARTLPPSACRSFPPQLVRSYSQGQSTSSKPSQQSGLPSHRSRSGRHDVRLPHWKWSGPLQSTGHRPDTRQLTGDRTEVRARPSGHAIDSNNIHRKFISLNQRNTFTDAHHINPCPQNRSGHFQTSTRASSSGTPRAACWPPTHHSQARRRDPSRSSWRGRHSACAASDRRRADSGTRPPCRATRPDTCAGGHCGQRGTNGAVARDGAGGALRS